MCHTHNGLSSVSGWWCKYWSNPFQEYPVYVGLLYSGKRSQGVFYRGMYELKFTATEQKHASLWNSGSRDFVPPLVSAVRIVLNPIRENLVRGAVVFNVKISRSINWFGLVWFVLQILCGALGFFLKGARARSWWTRGYSTLTCCRAVEKS